MKDLNDDDKMVLIALHNGAQVSIQFSTGACPFGIKFADTGIYECPRRAYGIFNRNPAARPYTEDGMMMAPVSEWLDFPVERAGPKDYAYRSPVHIKPSAAGAIAALAAEFRDRPLSNPEKNALRDAAGPGIMKRHRDSGFGVEWYICGDKVHRRKVIYGLCLRGLLTRAEDGRIVANEAGRLAVAPALVAPCA